MGNETQGHSFAASTVNHITEHAPPLLTLPLLPRAEYTSVATSPTPPPLDFAPHTLPRLSSPLTPSPPPSLPTSLATPTVTLATDVLSTSLARPIPRAADHHNHASIPSKVTATDTLPSSLTPSPDHPESFLQQQTLPNVTTTVVPVTADTHNVSPQSSSGFQSPQCSSPPLPSPRPKTSKSVTRPLSGGSTSSRGSQRPVGIKTTTTHLRQEKSMCMYYHYTFVFIIPYMQMLQVLRYHVHPL